MHRLLHLSDPHLTASGFDMDGVNARAALDGLLHDLRHLPPLDLVVVTGDLADDGSAEGVAEVRKRVAAYAEARGVPHLYTTGNHDTRAGYAASLGSGHLGADAVETGPGCTAVSTTGGLRVVTLDSLVEGETHGVLENEQLSWLEEVLASPAPDGTVLALHHSPSTLTAFPDQAQMGLHHPEQLAEVIRGTDVRVVLVGHFHQAQAGTVTGVPVFVAPGIVTRIDRTAPVGVIRGVLGAGAGLLELGDDGDLSYLVLHARDPRAGEQVYEHGLG